MDLSSSGSNGLVARVNLPLYTIQMLTGRHILLGGGGGSANTGVSNGFEVYEVSHDGINFTAKESLRHETGPLVVMNCAVRECNNSTFLVAGQESHAQLYKVRLCTQTESVDANHTESGTVRSRAKSETNGAIPGSTKHSFTSKKSKLHFDLSLCDSVKTDFCSEEPLQKVVRISWDSKLMVTAGADGCIRIWTFPKMEKLLEISGHEKEVDDVDFSLDNKLVASVSKDGKARVWDVVTGKCLSELEWPLPKEMRYIPKRCRFAAVEERPGTSRLFVVTNPVGRTSKFRAYLQLWDPQHWSLRKVASCDETYAALAVRDDGRFVAAGTMFSGSVHIYIAFSLQRVHEVKSAHNMFVTALEFLPVSSPLAVASTAEAAVVSVSVDRRVCIHTLHYRRSLPAWLAIILIVFVLFVTFLLCSYIGI